MVYAALVVSGSALAFTIASFWWLHARTGSLEVAAPRSYAFADKVRLRLPLAFFNAGANALIVTDLPLDRVRTGSRGAAPGAALSR
jgi:hypothetical protein